MISTSAQGLAIPEFVLPKLSALFMSILLQILLPECPVCEVATLPTSPSAAIASVSDASVCFCFNGRLSDSLHGLDHRTLHHHLHHHRESSKQVKPGRSAKKNEVQMTPFRESQNAASRAKDPPEVINGEA
jgi:hypothetical protein